MLDRTSKSLSQRLNADLTHYMILCVGTAAPDCAPRPAYFAERTLEDSCSRAETIADLMAGQYGTVAKVFAFHPIDHTADDVTEDLAIDCANSIDPTQSISRRLYDFIAHNAGERFVRDLEVA